MKHSNVAEVSSAVFIALLNKCTYEYWYYVRTIQTSNLFAKVTHYPLPKLTTCHIFCLAIYGIIILYSVSYQLTSRKSNHIAEKSSTILVFLLGSYRTHNGFNTMSRICKIL